MLARRFVVIGAGIAGLTVARELALRGALVTVLEQGSQSLRALPGSATAASVGVLSAPRRGWSPLRRLQALAHAAYPAFVRQVEEESGRVAVHAIRGSLHLVRELPSEAKRKRQEATYRDAGVDCDWLDAAALRKMIPGISEGFCGALFIPAEGTVDPQSLLECLRVSCERLGVTTRVECGVTSLHGGEESWVELSSGETLKDAVFVVAAGAWSGGILRPSAALPEGLPVQPIRGQAIELRLQRGGAHLDPFPNLRFRPLGGEKDYHVLSLDSGRLWVGSTVEDVGFAAAATHAGLQELLQAAQEALPLLGEAEVVRQWAGLRPQALRRGGPFIGPLPGHPDVWVHCGHYRSGVLLSPLTGKLLVHLILGEEGAVQKEGFDLEALHTLRVDR